MGNPCTPNSVVGALAAAFEASGIKMDANALEAVGLEGEAQYHRTNTKIGSEQYDHSPENPDETHTLNTVGNTMNRRTIKKLFIDQRNPSGVLGEEFVQPVLKFTQDFHAAHWQNLDQARGDYTAGVKKVLKSINTDGLSASQKGYFSEWSNHLIAGGDLYPKSGKTGLGTLAANFAGNSIHSSPHVIFGHFISSSIKLASLYPVHALPGLAKAVSKGLFTEIPELANAGLYGVQHLEVDKGPLAKQWEGLVKLIDTPVANIFYYAGEAKGGVEGGLKAAQRGAFKTRLNDSPRQLWNSEGKSEVRFLNWTVNSMKLYSSLWADVATKPGKEKLSALTSLSLFHALPFVIGGAYASAQGKDFAAGGVATAIPSPVVSALSWINPETAQSIQENRTGLSEMLSIRDITGLAVATQAFSKAVFQDVPKSMHKSAEYFHNGETGNGFLEAGYVGLNLLKAMKFKGAANILTDGMVSKAYKIFKDDIENTATEDFGTQMQHLFLPFTKDPE